MKAIILCGGQGTRLREHTETQPKPMVRIGERPILWHIMKLYAHYDIIEFILCLGYKGHVIKDYFLNYEARNSDFTVEFGQSAVKYHGSTHDEYGWRVTLVDTGEAAMTGARVKRAARYLGDADQTFCVTYGDGLTDANLSELVKFHQSHGGLGTVTGVRPPSRFGELKVRGQRIAKFSEKPQVSEGVINGGFFVFERGFLDFLSNEDDCVLEREPLEHCAAMNQLFVYPHAGYWQCMDTHRDWEQLERLWRSGDAPWKVWI